jgi:hypothetical protein
VLEIPFGHEHDVVHERPHDFGGNRARSLDRNALRQGIAAHRQGVRLDHIVHGWIERGLHPNDLDSRLQRLGRHRHAGNQATAADRHDQNVEIGR